MQKVKIQDLGRIAYKEAWDLQSEYVALMIAEKRKLYQDPNYIYNPAHRLLFCEHNPVYTLGKSGKEENLLLDTHDLNDSPFEFFKINRGGDITYHGPGQQVVYPIFDLDFFFNDLHRYIRNLEEVIIQLLKEYNIEGVRLEGFTGVWIKGKENSHRKICAIGVHMSRWITMHGLAFNVNPDLDHFDNIIPCGIAVKDKTVTSLEKELGKKVSLNTIKKQLKHLFESIFVFQSLN